MTTRTLTFLALAAGLLASLAPATADPGQLAVRAGRVLDGTGKVLENATIWIEDGKIVKIDQTAPPAGAEVLDYSKATIIPGLVAATSQIGVARGAGNDQTSEVTPTFRVGPSLDDRHDTVRTAVQLGITTAYVRPGLDNVVGGFGAVVRPGADGAAFVADGKRDLLVACGPWPSSGNMRPGWGGRDNPFARRPSTRMGVVWLIRKSFHDGRVFARTGEVGDLEKETPGAYSKAELKTLAAALAGKLTVRFVARADKDVRTALRIAEEFSLPKIRIEGLVEGYRGPKALDALKGGLIVEIAASEPISAIQPVNARRLPMAVGALRAWFSGTHDPSCVCCSLFLQPRRDPLGRAALSEGIDEPTVVTPSYGPRADNAALMAQRNPRTALASADTVPDLLLSAAYAVRHGMDEQAALAAITRVPAHQLGMSRQVGTIAPGKRADLVVLSGAPFEVTTRVLAVYSDGRRVFALEDLLR